MEFQGPRQQTL